MSSEPTYRCGRCQRYFPAAGFSHDGSKKDGVGSRCRECERIHWRERYHRDPALRVAARLRKQEAKIARLEALDARCKKGETVPAPDLRRRLTLEEQAEVRELVRTGATAAVLVERYGLTLGSAEQLVRRIEREIMAELKQKTGRSVLHDPATRKAVLRRYAAGETANDLCREFGTCLATLRKYVLAAGIHWRTREEYTTERKYTAKSSVLHNPERRAEILARYAAGASAKTLRQEHHISTQTLRKYVLADGQEWRDRKAARQIEPPKTDTHQRIARLIREQYRTVSAAAEFLGISRFTLNEYLRDGKLAGAFQIGGRNSDWLIPLDTLEAFKSRPRSRKS